MLPKSADIIQNRLLNWLICVVCVCSLICFPLPLEINRVVKNFFLPPDSVGCFVVCWTPALVVLLLDGLNCDRSLVLGPEKYCLVLAECNSFVNPIIYCFRDQDMRRTFKEILCCNWSQRHKNRGFSEVKFHTVEQEVLSESNGINDSNHNQNKHML